MKLLFYLSIIVFLFTQLNIAYTQGKKFEFKIGTGISPEVRPAVFREFWSPGLYLGSYFGYHISRRVQAGFALSYHTFAVDGQALKAAYSPYYGIRAEGIKLIDVTGNLNINVLSRNTFNVCVTSGIGTSIGIFRELEITDPFGEVYNLKIEKGAHLVYCLGFGIDFTLEWGYHFFVEIHSHTLFLPRDYFIYSPIVVGIVF